MCSSFGAIRRALVSASAQSRQWLFFIVIDRGEVITGVGKGFPNELYCLWSCSKSLSGNPFRINR